MNYEEEKSARRAEREMREARKPYKEQEMRSRTHGFYKRMEERY